MAGTFQVRSTQLDAFYTKSWKENAPCGAGGASVALVSDSSTSGLFGASKISLNTGTGNAGLSWVGIDALPLGSAWSILMRIVPTWTNAPSTVQGLICSGSDDGGNFGGIMLRATTDQKLTLLIKDNVGNQLFNAASTNTIPWTSGTPIDILVTFTNDNTSGGVKFYYANNGNNNSSAGTGTATGGLTFKKALGSAILTGLNGFNGSTGSKFYINEIYFDNTALAGTFIDNRTNFVSESAFEGYVYTDPGVNNVRNGTSYTFNGISETGNCVVPTTGNVKTGVIFDTNSSLTGTYDGSDRWTDPGATNVRNGTAYKANSTTNNRTGSCVVPAASDVRNGVSVDAGTGNCVVPTAANVKTGITYDSNSSITGTYNGSDRWTDPGTANVRSGTAYKANSTTNNETGTLAVPSANDVRNGTSVDAGTGNLVVPIANQVKHGVAFESSGGQTGTYTGSDLWTDPGASNVKIGVGYTGNGVSETGTYDGSDRWTDPGAANVLNGVNYKANSTTNNKTGTLTSTDPGVGNVSAGVNYEINSTLLTGTKVDLTLQTESAILRAGPLAGTLREGST